MSVNRDEISFEELVLMAANKSFLSVLMRESGLKNLDELTLITESSKSVESLTGSVPTPGEDLSIVTTRLASSLSTITSRKFIASAGSENSFENLGKLAMKAWKTQSNLTKRALKTLNR
jgi:hypothetical protein